MNISAEKSIGIICRCTAGIRSTQIQIRNTRSDPAVQVFYVSGYGDRIPSHRVGGRGRAQNGL